MLLLLWLLQLLINALELLPRPPLRGRKLMLLHFPNPNNSLQLLRRNTLIHFRFNNSIRTILSLAERKSWQKTTIWTRRLF